ncbi:UDP-N-acetylmuramoyl-tripeptide--D-alanyl-D-alanine ligase [Spongiactinospora gelatinilytica]|uniref:UDP-N-acetylmuramoyl-tripeptide--D-alanyl-D-alanine ligase n=2 Tax=Spongiactinospora gelatinilytica TaxID=2666298 RepID=A0A2W2GJV8_9ACTN|nr:UDP-N-acetylmuramoyl-tripeptide--D-alanyl-D-alanine ligase [Spongiactinospora gelatinilytica]
MLPMSLGRVAEIVAGKLHEIPDPSMLVAGPVIVDSRRVVPGSLFAAFRGERADGHDHAVAAVGSGAAAVLASRPVPAPAIVVDDVQAALNALTHWTARAIPAVTRIGITGSCGKTSTKDLLGQILDRLGPTVATQGSQNNEIGVPLTVLSATTATRYLVLEMGARGIGHLRHLTGMVPLDVAVVLNVGTAHAGEFGSRQATAQAKGELVEALDTDGAAVLNADDPLVAAMEARSAAPVVWYGRGSSAQVRAIDVRITGGRPRFELHTPEGRATVELPLVGEHHVSNALAAAAAAFRLGMPTGQIAEALSTAAATSGSRMQVHERPDGVTIVDDAYNANPDSMAAALQALVSMAAGRRTIGVLGDMRELGAESAGQHRAVGELAARLGVDIVVGVGAWEAAAIVAGAADGGTTAHLVDGQQAALRLLSQVVREGDVVLVKASHGAALDALARDLTAMPPTGGAVSR